MEDPVTVAGIEVGDGMIVDDAFVDLDLSVVFGNIGTGSIGVVDFVHASSGIKDEVGNELFDEVMVAGESEDEACLEVVDGDTVEVG